LRPGILTGYPSLLQQLAKEVHPGDMPLELVVTNSEQSSRVERDRLQAVFGCDVLDEYSSEELTRIAIELPDKHYYVCEDSVFLEVLHPETRKPVANGEWGEAVVTGLLNKAMPFVRYATGDLVRRPRKPPAAPWKSITWSPLEAIGGRILDSFIRPDGGIVPSGAMLDVVYRAFYDVDVCVDRFELVQVSPLEARLNLVRSRTAKARTVAEFAARVEELLAFVLGTRVKLAVNELETWGTPRGKQKRRPIRREFCRPLSQCRTERKLLRRGWHS
jgi:phenylacetate-CoA ligase